MKTIILRPRQLDAAFRRCASKPAISNKTDSTGELISDDKTNNQAAVTDTKRSEGLWNFQDASRESTGRTWFYARGGVRLIKIRKIFWQDIELSLTPIEAKTIEALIENYQNLVAPERLVYLIYDYQTNAQDAAKTLRPIISRLYKKLSVISGGAHWIQNVRGSGYLLNFSPDQLIR